MHPNDYNPDKLYDDDDDEVPGCLNTSADKVGRVDKTWSDCNLDRYFFSTDKPFNRLICLWCKSTMFEILQTDDYETTAKCQCGHYYIVHSG